MTDESGTAVVLGASGGFGRAFAGLMQAGGIRVVGVDVASRPGLDDVPLIVGDATHPDDAVTAAVAKGQWLVVCLPDEAALPAVDRLHRALPGGALVVDTISVKSPIAAWVATTPRGDIEFLSLNPLFAPDLGFAGRRVAAVPLRTGVHSQRFLRMVERAGAEVVELSADEHDREAALTQALVHAAVLAVGRCLAASPDPSTWRLVTPPFRLLTLLVGRVIGGDGEVYRHIQSDNPHAARIRRALGDAVIEVDGSVGSPEQFEALIDAIRDGLGPLLPELRTASAQLLRTLPTAVSSPDATLSRERARAVE